MDRGTNGNRLTTNCSAAALIKQCSSQMGCPVDVNATFHKSTRVQLWRVDALLVVEAILAAVIVGIGAYGERYRHHPIIRFVFLGATTLFLPIISSISSSIDLHPHYFIPLPSDGLELSAVVARCDALSHMAYFIILASLVQIVTINTTTIIAVDGREGECKGPPLELLVQAVWTIYLCLTIQESFGHHNTLISATLFVPYALLSSKIGLKYFAFEKARRSLTLGRNPGLVFAYMRHLKEKEGHLGQLLVLDSPPPLLVAEGSEVQVKKHPYYGYIFVEDRVGRTFNKNVGQYMTLDRVWRFDGMLLIARPWLKDLCFSYALFKLLRCRFARYKLPSTGGTVWTSNFFQSVVLIEGKYDRVFRMIAEELSFVHDYYYSSLPITYSNRNLPFLSILVSLLTIGYCVLITTGLINRAMGGVDDYQIWCKIWCVTEQMVRETLDTRLGGWYFDVVPLLFLLFLVVTAEIRDIASYICSNWTKVTLLCHYINRGSSRRHLVGMQKWVSILLGCRCKLIMKQQFNDEMSQCCVLLLQPRKDPLVHARRLFRLPDHKWKVKVPQAVKVSIMSALRSSISYGGLLNNGVESLRRNQVGESFLWACNGTVTSDIILTWHIATSILEVKHTYRPDDEEQGSPLSYENKIIATHLSKYCAYLMDWYPELLPGNNAWSKDLYEEVKKDAERALAGHAVARSSIPEDEYQKLVELLGANSKHDMLKNGVKLGKQLVEIINDEEIVWKLLADFWSDMILYVAPSDNLKGHSEAIARGGEFITVLWALLFHSGIVSRPASGEEDGDAPTEPPSAGAF